MKSEKFNPNYMNKASLKKLSKSELIRLLLKQQNKKPKIIVVDNTKPVPATRAYKPRPPVPTPRKSVKQAAKEYEENIILPPAQFRDDYKPVPTPRTYKPLPTPRKSVKQIVQDYEDNKPVPTPRTSSSAKDIQTGSCT